MLACATVLVLELSDALLTAAGAVRGPMLFRARLLGVSAITSGAQLGSRNPTAGVVLPPTRQGRSHHRQPVYGADTVPVMTSRSEVWTQFMVPGGLGLSGGGLLVASWLYSVMHNHRCNRRLLAAQDRPSAVDRHRGGD